MKSKFDMCIIIIIINGTRNNRQLLLFSSSLEKSANQSASEQSLTIDEWILTQLPDNVKQYYINLIIME